MKILLKEVFIGQPKKAVYHKQDLFALKIKPAFIHTLAAHLKLSYQESASLEGNVCFANNSEVRPEFRTVFNKVDIIRYVSSFLTKAAFDLEAEEVPFPQNPTMFWNCAKGNNKDMML